MNYFNLFLGLFFVLMAWLVYLKPELINPYGNMQPEQKALVDIVGLKRSLAIIFAVCAGLLLLISLLGFLHLIPATITEFASAGVAILMLIPLTVAMIRHNGFGHDASGEKGERKWMRFGWHSKTLLVSLPGLLVLLIVVPLLLFAARPPQVTVENGVLHAVSGVYKRDVALDEIKSMKVLDGMPTMKKRVNGTGLASRSLGLFRTTESEDCFVLVEHNGGPCLELRTDSELMYLNCKTPEGTHKLIEDLKVLIDKNVWR
ncbi:MAG: DUF3784 domain-containing protein [Bacteroidales bacterium]|nr:DUF3784 domain-containing protein [Bacteroidales bacterium]